MVRKDPLSLSSIPKESRGKISPPPLAQILTQMDAPDHTVAVAHLYDQKEVATITLYISLCFLLYRYISAGRLRSLTTTRCWTRPTRAPPPPPPPSPGRSSWPRDCTGRRRTSRRLHPRLCSRHLRRPPSVRAPSASPPRLRRRRCQSWPPLPRPRRWRL